MVPNWILKLMEMVGVAGNVRDLINKSVKNWNTEVTAWG